MAFKAVLFDLDGTLLDTLADLAKSMNDALAQMGYPTHPVADYAVYVGDGAYMEAKRTLPPGHRDEQTIQKCIELMRESYRNCWADNTKPYPGVAELLDALEQRGVAKAVLSNKPDDFARLITEKLLDKWTFATVQGLTDEIPKKPDPTIALGIAEQMNIPPRQFLYLGDTDTDMKTAVSAGMYPVGAAWGFRSPEELAEHGAKRIIDHPLELMAILDEHSEIIS